MSSLSIFDTMEFPMSMENYLDESFGLSAEILAADLGCEGGILDSDLGQYGALKFESEQPTSAPVDDVLLLSDVADSLGQEWMEQVDLKVLLNSFGDGQSLQVSTNQPAVPVTVTPPEPISTSTFVANSEQRKEGMKASAYEKLKALLTGQSQEDELVEFSSSPVELSMPTTPVSPQSPEALVPNLPFVVPSFESLLEESSENVLEDLIRLPPADSIGDNVTIVQSNIDLIELLSPVTDVSQSINSDNDSYYTSGPSSPTDSVTLETVDLAQLDELNPVSDKSSQISDHEFTKLKSKSRKECVRSVPYEVETPRRDKKDRKKVQNKNAATRYRVKKREEKQTLQQQENGLADKNKELKEKVESLQREISYMKELMNEIYKAKKNKI